MATAKHAPGPWDVTLVDGHETIVERDWRGDAEDAVIATMSGHYDTEEEDANRDLIAAAPALADALEAARSELQNHEKCDASHGVREALQEIEAALRAAGRLP